MQNTKFFKILCCVKLQKLYGPKMHDQSFVVQDIFCVLDDYNEKFLQLLVHKVDSMNEMISVLHERNHPLSAVQFTYIP
jgi:hypothetical protein